MKKISRLVTEESCVEHYVGVGSVRRVQTHHSAEEAEDRDTLTSYSEENYAAQRRERERESGVLYGNGILIS